jgi:hypothetical protein
MGSSFFHKGGAPKFTMGSQVPLAKAVGSAVYASRGAAAGAQKDLGAAAGINNAGARKPLQRSAAYPKGPKI